MKVLIIGGTKFIGKEIARRTIQGGHDVVLFNRGLTKHELQIENIKGDVNELLEYKEVLLNHKFDIIVHCIAYTEKHADDLVSVFKNTKSKLIVLSSCDCYEAFQGLNRKIDKAELPISESSPTSSLKYYWRDFKTKGSMADEYDKNLMTEVLIDSFKNGEINTTIFRLPMVYGPGDHQYPGRHGAIIQRILDEKDYIIFSDREQCQIYTYGYIENVAAAIVHSFDKLVTNGKIYNIGESKSRSRRRWAGLYSEIANWNFDYHILPEELLRKDPSYRAAPPQLLLTDNSLYTQDTGFVEPIDLKECIKRTFEYAKNNKSVLGETPDYSGEEILLKKYYSCIDTILSELEGSSQT
ncbi:MAG: NAD-dependent epimerase/dehydratase family protein [Bdellovibrionaceae bacterium]|nr:NAD-dependent epimerase/dehydratase family protein [Pseudobdellovibrionaceae bacterium]